MSNEGTQPIGGGWTGTPAVPQAKEDTTAAGASASAAGTIFDALRDVSVMKLELLQARLDAMRPSSAGFTFSGAPSAASLNPTGGFGGFGAATSAGSSSAAGGFGGFGAASSAPSLSAAGGFGGFGAASNTASSSAGFGGFGATTSAASSSPASGFGGFGAAPSAASSSAGFGAFGAASSVASSSAAGGFGGFGAASSAASSSAGFGGFGAASNAASSSADGGFSGFGAASSASSSSAAGFGGFGAASSSAGFFAFGDASSAASSSAAGGFGFGAAPSAASSSAGFGAFGDASSAASSSAAGGFGGFGAAPSAASSSAAGGFGGVGAASNTASSSAGFGGFGAATSAASSSAAGGFGGFGAAPSAASSSAGFGGGFEAASNAASSSAGFGGFGAAANASSSATGDFTFSGATSAASSSAASGFGGFGAASNAASSSAGFGGFGAASSSATGGFGGFGAASSVASSSAAGAFGGFGAASNAASSSAAGGFGAASSAASSSAGGYGGFSFGAGPSAPSSSAAGGFSFGADSSAASSSVAGGFGGFGAASSSASTGGFGGFGAASSAASSSAASGFGGFGAASNTASSSASGAAFCGFGAASNASSSAAGGFGSTASSSSAAGGFTFSSTDAAVFGSFGGAVRIEGGYIRLTPQHLDTWDTVISGMKHVADSDTDLVLGLQGHDMLDDFTERLSGAVCRADDPPTTLLFYGSLLSDTAAAWLGAILELPLRPLLCLDLSCADISPTGISVLCGSLASGKRAVSDTTIVLHDNPHQHHWFTELGQALASGNCPNSLALHLSWPDVTPADMRCLAEALESGECPSDLSLVFHRNMSLACMQVLSAALSSGRCPTNLSLSFGAMATEASPPLCEAISSKTAPHRLSLSLGLPLGNHFREICAALKNGTAPTHLQLHLRQIPGPAFMQLWRISQAKGGAGSAEFTAFNLLLSQAGIENNPFCSYGELISAAPQKSLLKLIDLVGSGLATSPPPGISAKSHFYVTQVGDLLDVLSSPNCPPGLGVVLEAPMLEPLSKKLLCIVGKLPAAFSLTVDTPRWEEFLNLLGAPPPSTLVAPGVRICCRTDGVTREWLRPSEGFGSEYRTVADAVEAVRQGYASRVQKPVAAAKEIDFCRPLDLLRDVSITKSHLADALEAVRKEKSDVAVQGVRDWAYAQHIAAVESAMAFNAEDSTEGAVREVLTRGLAVDCTMWAELESPEDRWHSLVDEEERYFAACVARAGETVEKYAQGWAAAALCVTDNDMEGHLEAIRSVHRIGRDIIAGEIAAKRAAWRFESLCLWCLRQHIENIEIIRGKQVHYEVLMAKHRVRPEKATLIEQQSQVRKQLHDAEEAVDFADLAVKQAARRGEAPEGPAQKASEARAALSVAQKESDTHECSMAEAAVCYYPEMEVGDYVEWGGLICRRRLADYTSLKSKNDGCQLLLQAVTPEGSSCLLKRFTAGEGVQGLLREARALHRLQHPCIAEVVCVFEDVDAWYMETPLYSRGSLADSLHTCSPTAWQLALDITQALACVHRNGMVHCNVCPGNIFIDGDGRARLGGFSSWKEATKGAVEGFLKGSLMYHAPEVVSLETPHTTASDMYALGLVIYDLVTPTKRISTTPPLESVTQKEASDILSVLLSPSPSDRPTAEEVILHPYFRISRQGVVDRSTPATWANPAARGAISGADELLDAMQDMVTKSYAKPGGGLKVTKVFRVEHADLWMNYQVQRAQMQQRLAGREIQRVAPVCHTTGIGTEHLSGDVNELHLFHGTVHTRCIISEGMDDRVAKSGLHGAGLYFAESSSKADEYMHPNLKGECDLFVCRVLLGRPHMRFAYPTDLDRSARRPPCIQGHMETAKCGHSLADSIVASLRSKPREFVVYDRSHVYPEFLLRVRRA